MSSTDLRAGGQGGGSLESRSYTPPANWKPRILESTAAGVVAVPQVVELKPGEVVEQGNMQIINIRGHVAAIQTIGDKHLASFSETEMVLADGDKPTDAVVIYKVAE
jgi:hypothetical protein